MCHIVCSSVDPPSEFVQQTFAHTVTPGLCNGVVVLNTRFTQWKAQDRNVNSLLLSFLAVEALSKTLNANIALDVCTTLHSAYVSRSKARELRPCDQLLLMRHGSLSVSEHGRKFRTICDQLAAIVAPVSNDDKFDRFLRGLGVSYATFSTDQLDQVLLPLFLIFFVQSKFMLLFMRLLRNR